MPSDHRDDELRPRLVSFCENPTMIDGTCWWAGVVSGTSAPLSTAFGDRRGDWHGWKGAFVRVWVDALTL